MNDRNQYEVNQNEQLVQQMQSCEKLIDNCSIEQFANLRYELKQVKEKLRMLNQWNRLK